MTEWAQQNHAETAVELFAGGEEFLAAQRSAPFDIVFLDIYMDGITGVETAERLRERDSSCKVVFLTTSSEFMLDALHLHAFDYIIKPVTAKAFAKTMNDIIHSETAEPLPTISVLSGRHYLEIFLRD